MPSLTSFGCSEKQKENPYHKNGNAAPFFEASSGVLRGLPERSPLSRVSRVLRILRILRILRDLLCVARGVDAVKVLVAS